MNRIAMIVLSLFDGMSCGQIALRDMGIIPEIYYASEIDKFAIAQTQLNFPETIQLGSVTDVDATKLGHIDLLIGGSPCQSFSFAGKRIGMATTDKEEIYTLERYLELKRDGFQFEGQSYLFWEYMRILNEVRQTNPDVLFLLENVEMGKKWEKVLSDAIGINGVHINSALVSAQTRKRIYWTNIRTANKDLFGQKYSDIPLPEDRNIFLQDILLDEVDEKYYVSDAVLERMRRSNYSKPAINPEKTGTINTKNNSGQMSLDSGTTFIRTPVVKDRGNLRKIDKSNCIVANYWKGMDNHGMRTMVHEERFTPIHIPEATKKGYAEIFPGECFDATQLGSKTRRGRRMSKKCNCLMSQNIPEYYLYKKVSNLPKNRIINNIREINEKGNCLLATVYKGSQANGVTLIKLPVQLNPSTESNGGQSYQQNRIYSDKGLSPAVMVNMTCGSYAVQTNERIRRLTPTECARLQTIPDWYKWECSETQQYKMLGNGWTVEVIKHIFSFLPKQINYKRNL